MEPSQQRPRAFSTPGATGAIVDAWSYALGISAVGAKIALDKSAGPRGANVSESQPSEKMGRPPKEINAKQVEKLAAMFCTVDEIAAFFDSSRER